MYGIGSSCGSEKVAAILVLLLMLAILPATVFAAPTTVITLDPTLPDGVPPWYVSTPEVFATPSQSGTLYWWVDSGAVTTAAVTTGTPLSLGFAADGTHTYHAYTVSTEETETPGAARIVQTDREVPSQPTGFTGALSVDAVSLSWSASTDTVSGVGGYYVYRNEDGFLYDIGDRINFVDSGLDFDDTDDLSGWMRWYAISTRDEAGNEGFLSSSIRYGRTGRVWGVDRYLTALEVSREGFDASSVTTVVVASGMDYPDALCASGLAGMLSSPILLVGSGALRTELESELTRLGATDAYVIGGETAVSTETLTSLDDFLPGDVSRVWGATRYETAAAVEEVIRGLRGGGPAPRAYVASGLAFPDAASISPAAYTEGAPILYATPDTVPEVSRTAISASGAPQAVILGSDRAVWSGAEGVLPDPVRIAGANRFGTSRLIADWVWSEDILRGPNILVATAWVFPDGLSAGAFGGFSESPVILSDSSDADALRAWLSVDPSRFDRALLIGGTSAIGDDVGLAVSEGLAIP